MVKQGVADASQKPIDPSSLSVTEALAGTFVATVFEFVQLNIVTPKVQAMERGRSNRKMSAQMLVDAMGIGRQSLRGNPSAPHVSRQRNSGQYIGESGGFGVKNAPHPGAVRLLALARSDVRR